MKSFWYILYNFLVLPFLQLFVKFAALFNSKLKKGLDDRKRLFENLILNCADLNRKKKLIWFHSASMGEFEQAKPIIKKLKEERNVNVLVTFFSPSGYRNSLKYPDADIISYLPIDTPINVSRFTKIVKPSLVILMRYDIWPNLIWYLHRVKIPTMIVDATMRKSSKRKWFIAKGFHKTVYRCFTKILTVSQDDSDSFSEFAIVSDKLKPVGDTRFDRVHQKSLNAKDKKLFADGFLDGKKVFVCGSSWENDEDVILPAFLKLMKYDKDAVLILVPHEPTVLHLEKLEHTLTGKEKSIRFSYLNNYSGERIIIIDSIGILLTLYTYAHIAYVGGSFKQGIHNVLEPAVYGIPVLFGPKIENSQEAQNLANGRGGFIVRNKKEAYRRLRKLLSDEELRQNYGKLAYEYVFNNIGATRSILDEIYKVI
ncbi:MAG: glycosyltransferase N-terminal domain-containing protein [Bacteroidota bacterium]